MVGVDQLPLSGFEGGGIFQNFSVSAADAGDLSISLDIAVNGTANSSGGWFELLVDGATIAQHNFGSISVGTPVERASLFGTANSLGEGNHELRILMRRNFQNIGGITPIQYLDNITFLAPGAGGAGAGVDNNGVTIPEPSAVALLGSGLLGMFLWNRRKAER